MSCDGAVPSARNIPPLGASIPVPKPKSPKSGTFGTPAGSALVRETAPDTLEVIVATHIDPFILQHEDADFMVLVDQRQQQFRHVQRLALRDAGQHLGGQHVDAGADEVVVDGFLDDALQAAVAHLEHAIRYFDAVSAGAYRGAAPAGGMKVHQMAEIDARQDVAIGDHQRVCVARRQQGQDPGRAHEFLFADIADAAVEGAAVAKVVLDHVAQVIDCEAEFPEAVVPKPQQYPFEDRFAAHRHHRFWQVLPEGQQPLALAPGHDHHMVGPLAMLQAEQQVVHGNAGHHAFGADQRHLLDLQHLHPFQYLLSCRPPAPAWLAMSSGGSSRPAAYTAVGA